MLALIGNPRGTYDEECRFPTNQHIISLVETDDFGPFKATGLRPALRTLKAIMADIKSEAHEVHDVMSHVGMLCCRFVRGSTSSISNHSWGTAIDLTLENKLDRRGDGRTQRGLLEIHPIFNRHGFFWGAAFGTEDCMHFEASDQLVRQWASDGEFGAGSGGGANGVMEFGDRGPQVQDLQERLNLVLGLDLDVDGIFGPATRAGVMEFQRLNSLEVTGIVSEETLSAIKAVT